MVYIDVDVYENVGKFKYDFDVNDFRGVDTLTECDLEYKLFFENDKKLIIQISTLCCDHWIIKEKDLKEEDREFNHPKYEKTSLKNMDGKEIDLIKILNNVEDEYGTVILFSKTQYCKLHFRHIHSGYYPMCFDYYTNLDKSYSLTI